MKALHFFDLRITSIYTYWDQYTFLFGRPIVSHFYLYSWHNCAVTALPRSFAIDHDTTQSCTSYMHPTCSVTHSGETIYVVVCALYFVGVIYSKREAFSDNDTVIMSCCCHIILLSYCHNSRTQLTASPYDVSIFEDW